MALTRRRFVGIAGLTAAGSAAAVSAVSRLERVMARRDEWYDRTEERIPSICQLCPGGCGLSVRVVDGVPVKVEGNPLHPVNRGRLCPRGLAGLQSLYDPDRLVTPARRVGKRGSGEWEKISWDEALEILAARLGSLRDSEAPQSLAVLGGDFRGMTHRLWDRFAAAFGTPNYVRMRTLAPEEPGPVAAMMHGEQRPISYDLAEASFVLSFGCSWLDGWRSPVHQMRAYGEMRSGRNGGRAEIVHVEPRMSMSAASADQWVPIKPGTEGVFALGLAHPILRERLHDEKFINNNVFGFEDWTGSDGRRYPGYREMVLEEYTPVRVSEITGVRPETIVSVARRFALKRPAIALDDDRPALQGHDLFTRMAIHSLNVLVGSIGAVGGVLPGNQAPPLAAWPDIKLDETARRGLATRRLDGAGSGERFLDDEVPRGLAEAVMDESAAGLEVLFLHRANPLYGRPDKELFQQALEQVPMVVSLTSVPDETSRYADLVLPEHNFLERWQDDEVTFLAGFTAFSVGRPTVEPLYNTRHGGEVVLALARKVGGSVAAAFPWATYEECLRETCRGLFDSGRGNVVSGMSDEMLRHVLQRQGYRAPEFDSYSAFWEAISSSGAWWERFEPHERTLHSFNTPSGKLELIPQLLTRRLEEAANEQVLGTSSVAEEKGKLLAALEMAPGADLSLYPRLLVAAADAAEGDEAYPLLLKTYELLTIGGGVGANLPWLQESIAVHVDGAWDCWVEIHPDTAHALEVQDGDMVVVQSTAGELTLRARLDSGTRSDVVAIPVGQGHSASGRWARDRGVDPSDLVTSVKTAGEGLGFGEPTRVRVRRTSKEQS